MPPTGDHRSMHLDPHILDFLKALEDQGGPALSTLSAASARAAIAQVNDTLRKVFAHKAPQKDTHDEILCSLADSRWE